MTLRYTDRALLDVELALTWYERQRSGLGLEFLDCVEEAIVKIVENSAAYSVRYNSFRGCVVRKFPFTIFYTVEDDELIVHSVFHHRRDPESQP